MRKRGLNEAGSNELRQCVGKGSGLAVLLRYSWPLCPASPEGPREGMRADRASPEQEKLQHVLLGPSWHRHSLSQCASNSVPNWIVTCSQRREMEMVMVQGHDLTDSN